MENISEVLDKIYKLMIRRVTEKNDNAIYEQELVKISKNAGIGGGSLVIGSLITYSATILATRVVGAELFGVFFLAQTILSITVLVATLGLSQGVLRYVAFYQGKKDDARMKGTMLFGLKRVFIVSGLFTVLIFLISPLLTRYFFQKPNFDLALQVLIIALPFAAVLEIILASLQGLRNITQHALVRNILPSLFRLFFLAVLFAMGFKLMGLLWATVFSVALGFVIGVVFLYKKFFESRKQTSAIYERAEITKFSKPLFFESLLTQLISALPILILGYYFTATDVGVFGIGLRLGMIISLPLTAFNLIFAPTISNLYGRGEKTSLARLFKTVTKWIFTLSLAAALVMILFAKPILSLFGPQFVAGTTVLYLIVFSELINAGVGSAGYMLMMTGRPKINLMNSVILCTLTLILGLIFIPKYGILGAALTTAICVAIVNILRLAEVYYFERMHPYNRKFTKPVLAGMISSLVVLGMRSLMPQEQLGYTVFLILLFGLIFTITLIALRLEQEDLYIINLLSRKFSIT